MSRENRSRTKKRYISRERKFKKRVKPQRCRCAECSRNRLFAARKRRAELLQKIKDWREDIV